MEPGRNEWRDNKREKYPGVKETIKKGKKTGRAVGGEERDRERKKGEERRA